MTKKNIILRKLGICEYTYIFNAMYKFTKKRTKNTIDEIWFLQHFPVFTEGLSYKNSLLSQIKNIPVIKSNRGGKTTYHAPGQQIIYVLLDLKKNKINIRDLINILENTTINTLLDFGIKGYTKNKYPGVYVHQKKICSLGLRIYNGCSMHGLALNVNMNLKPFNYIHPCGNKNIKMTQIKDFIKNINIKNVEKKLIKHMLKLLTIN